MGHRGAVNPAGRLFCFVAHPSACVATRRGLAGQVRRRRITPWDCVPCAHLSEVIRSDRVKPFAVFPCATDALHRTLPRGGVKQDPKCVPSTAPTLPDINNGEVKDSLMNVNRGRRDPLTTLDLSLMSWPN